MQEFVGARSIASERARARKDACAGVTECLHVIFYTGRGKQGLVSVRMDEPLSASARVCADGKRVRVWRKQTWGWVAGVCVQWCVCAP